MADGLLDSGGDACQESDGYLADTGEPMGRLAYRAPESVEMKKKGDLNAENKKVVCLLGAVMLAAGMMAFPVCAKEANVAGVIEETWSSAAGQIKTVVDNVVFPAIDMILAVFFFGKLGTAYFDYRKHGQFDWAPPAILFVCLVLMLTAPMYVWKILGI